MPPPAATGRRTLPDGRELVVVADEAAAAAELVSETAKAARAAVAAKGAFSMAVSGGDVATALAGLAQEAGLDFSKFHVFFTHGAQGSDAAQAHEGWLAACGVPAAQVKRLPDMSFPEGAAAKYTAMICSSDEAIIGDSPKGLPSVDLMLLTTDDEGGCGGIRAGSPEAEATGKEQVVLFGENNVAVSIDFINGSPCCLVLAAPVARAGTISRALTGDAGDSNACPATAVRAPRTVWIATAASASEYAAQT